MQSHILASIQQALISRNQLNIMVDPVEVQCSLSCNLLNLFHVLRDCCSNASHPLPSKRLAQELSFEANNKRLKETDPKASERDKSNFRVEDDKTLWKMRRRPSKLFIPEPCTAEGFAGDRIEENILTTGEEYIEVKGRGYSLACQKGHKFVMEDGYGAISNINGCSKQAFFGVFDGHGGRAAVDFVSEKLGENIVSALAGLEREENQLDLATKAGYLATDREFIRLGARSGACAATVLLKGGELSAANVGDCRVVLSRSGAAEALTIDHSAGREDERRRIEDSGGYVTCWNGVWRVQDSLAVSRSIGDADMKEWIISEPETRCVTLTRDCEFLVMASDGLWVKVGNQEAVDVVLKQNDTIRACKELIELSQRRGSKDDITVMVVNLRDFVQQQ